MSAPLGLDGLFTETPKVIVIGGVTSWNNNGEGETTCYTVTCDLSSDPLRGSQYVVYVIDMSFLHLQQNSLGVEH